MVARRAARRRPGCSLLSFLGRRQRVLGSCRSPASCCSGLGLGFTFVPLSNLALVGAGEHDAGAASAMLNATQQVGASIGTALLATLSVGAITAYFADAVASGARPAGPGRRAAGAGGGLHDGVHLGRRRCWSLGALVSAVLIKATKEDLPADGDAVVHVG